MRIIIFGLVTFLFAISSCLNHETKGSPEKTGKAVTVNSKRALIYTKHARCRMDCRHIDESEIQEIIAEDQINYRKSKENDSRCPTYAYEGYSHDRQHLRIIVAKCDDQWKIVTCIDLENDFKCDCY